MSFDDLYPDAEVGFEDTSSPHMVFKSDGVGPCGHCKTPTAWVEVNFEVPMCSASCDNALWTEYFAALLKSGDAKNN